MFWKFPLKIQTYTSENQQWGTRIFETPDEFTNYVESQFKESPEHYNLHDVQSFQIEGLKYTVEDEKSGRPNFEGGVYTKALKGTHHRKRYFQNEKDKVLNGVIVDEFYIPPFYYWYLNFCPIYDAVKKVTRLPDVWDGDLWYMHYCMLAILKGRHIGGVKGRQKGYSYKHMAILYWSYCWFERSVNTIGAFDENLVKKSWRFLEGYRKHINTKTDWKRGPVIPKTLEWHEVTMGQDNNTYGNHAKLKGVTFKQTPFNDVGGAQTFFNYEEPGVSPTLLDTIEATRPALERGSLTTGIIIACGSVGELDDAAGIKAIFYTPEDYNFLSVKNIWDKNPERERCCIFISEAYNMDGVDDLTGQPFMDKNGNSNVKLSLEWIARVEEKIKNSSKRADLKQLQLSQKCISPEQAFAQRKMSEFPVELLKKQQERIKLKEETNAWEFKPKKGLFAEGVDGKIILSDFRLPEEHRYPINPEWEDKRGVWTIYEPPDEDAEFFTYFACVDAIEVDQTDTSASIASVDIFKTSVEVTYRDTNGKISKRIEGDKLVATYRGRFDTARKTNEQIWLGLKLYNAFTYAERNKPNFINYMREIGKAEKYLAKEQDVPLFKDLNVKSGNGANNSKFGFHKGDNTEIWKYFKAYTKEYFHTEYNRTSFEGKDGNEKIIKLFTGIDRIDDYWLLEEFIRYVEVKGKIVGNYDRLVSFMGALFICKIYQQNRYIKRKSEIVEEKRPEYRPPRRTDMLGGTLYKTMGKPRKPHSMI
jgi:hypothetical protein